MKILVALVAALAVAAPLAAQTRRSTEPPVSIRGFFVASEEQFAAKTTFAGVFGSSMGSLVGGGAQVVFRGGVYVEVSGSRFQKSGQRGFFSNGQTFRLGIPLTASLMPIEANVGYRFRLQKHRTIIPYVAAGVGQYHYKETSTGSDPGEDVDATHLGYLANTGVEFRLHPWVGLSIDAQYTHIPGILGLGGISKDAGESDLGGYAARFKVIVGR
jgi:hypothetical protein